MITREIIQSDAFRLVLAHQIYSAHRAKRRTYEAKWRIENADKVKANQAKYNLTEKAKIRTSRYTHSPKALARYALYAKQHPEKLRAAQYKYNRTEKAKLKDRAYRKRHPEKIRQTKRNYALRNPDKIKQHRRSHHSRHSERLRAISRAQYSRIKSDPVAYARHKQLNAIRYNARWKSDPIFRLRNNLRLRLRQAIKGKQKDQRALELLGCSLEEFKFYFESLFTAGMSWEKVFDGSIHIDHKHPISKFDLTDPEQVKKCFHFSNLQPLWAEDNLRKSNKILTAHESLLQ